MDEIIDVGGGRRLAYSESGDPQGRPVIHLHGTPGSRLERYPDPALTASLGVRFIGFDRPGFGYSDPVPGRTLLDCAVDIGLLADHLGLDTFALNGISGGGPFVLAAAYALPERVSKAAISCGVGPMDRPGALDGMNPATAEEFDTARRRPEELAEFLAATNPADGLPPAEFAAFSSIPGLAEVLGEQSPEILRQGWAGVVADDLAYAGPWGFPLAEVTVPLRLWHGALDTMVPPHTGEYVARQVPGAELTVCEGKGHLDMFALQREVLEYLVGPKVKP